MSVLGEEKAVTLVVSDRGPGVPDFLEGELFDMFGSLALQMAGATWWSETAWAAALSSS